MPQAKREDFLPFSPPYILEDEIEEIAEAVRSGWITTGPRVRQFEADFAAYTGARAAHALNSCTGAMHVALAALGVGPGDEVITTPMTFCSSVHVIEHVGATPVLVDVEPHTLTLDPVRAASAVTERTRAILPVHYAGHPVDMDPLLELAEAHDLHIIEDAAHALPARYKGRMVGTIGTLTAFSFYATKNLTTAEGGMLTGAPDLIERARLFSLHGMSRDAWKRYTAVGSWYYEVVEAGFKYNMTDIQAAIGLVQLERLDAMQARRREIVARYIEGLAPLDAIQTPVEQPDCKSAWHLYVIRLHLGRLTIDRAQFVEELKARNIGASVHFIPVHIHPYYRDKYGFKPEDFAVSYREYKRLVSLPLHPGLSDADVDDVIVAVRDIVERFGA